MTDLRKYKIKTRCIKVVDNKSIQKFYNKIINSKDIVMITNLQFSMLRNSNITHSIYLDYNDKDSPIKCIIDGKEVHII